MPLLTLLTSKVGFAVMRRWWGGWCSPGGLVKRIAVFCAGTLLATFVNWNVIDHWTGYLMMLGMGGLMLATFLNTYHGEGQNMGRTGKKTWWEDYFLMAGSYGHYFWIMALSWALWLGSFWPFVMVPLAALIPLGYEVGWRIQEKHPDFKLWCKGDNCFIHGATTVGELGLGALLGAAFPFVAIVKNLSEGVVTWF